MDILNGSFYNTFKNKENLYIEALRRYSDVVTRKRTKFFCEQRCFIDSIQLFLKDIFKCLRDKTLPKGCMLCHRLADEILSKPIIKEYVFTEYQSFRDFFEDKIEQAQSSGEISSRLNS